MKHRKKCACCVLTQITHDSDASKTAIANDNLQAIEWVFEAQKEILDDINYLEKCGNKSNNEVNEKFVNLFKELTSEMQTDSEMTAEYFNFDGEGYTSSPVINSDKVNWRWTPIEASLNAYIFVGKVVREKQWWQWPWKSESKIVGQPTSRICCEVSDSSYEENYLQKSFSN